MKLPVRKFAGLASYVIMHPDEEPLIVDNVREDPWRPWYHQIVPSIQSAALAATRLDSRITGVVVAESEEPSHFRIQDRDALSQCAGLLGPILHHYRTSRILLEVTRLVASGSPIEQIGEQVLKHAYESTGAQSSSVRILDTNTHMLVVKAREGERKERAQEPIPVDKGINGLVFVKRTFEIIPDVAQWSDIYLPFNPATRSELTVPIQVSSEDEPFGVINLEHSGYSHFDTSDAEFVSELAHFLALAYTADRRAQRSLTREESTVGTEIAAALAHSMSSYLAAIQQYLKILKKRVPEDDEDGKRALAGIRRDAELTSEGAESILHQIREPHPGWVDSRSLLLEVIERGETRRPPSVDRPIVTIDESLARVWIDAAQLRVILENLLSNSYEAMISMGEPDRRGRVAISAKPAKDGTIRITFQDNGPGFAQNIREYVFKRPVSTKSDGDEHHGVGLWLAKRAMRSAGGDIFADETEPVMGATVTLVLPTRENK
jgi:signal transduction histidine kinase